MMELIDKIFITALLMAINVNCQSPQDPVDNYHTTVYAEEAWSGPTIVVIAKSRKILEVV